MSQSIIDEMIPPPSLNHVGDGDFKAIGEHFFKFFVELGGLKPQHKVLDVGCGIGRMAIPLTQYLSGEGRYEGFDIVKSGIDWCNDRITTRYRNFHFKHVDIVNKTYNATPDHLVATLRGQRPLQASHYRFPYEDNSFDFVFLTSVFTHMLPAEVENYMSEIHRVLKPSGRSLITYFLLNEESVALVDAGKAHLKIPHVFDNCRVQSLERPEDVIAYDEGFVRRLYREHGFRIDGFHYGAWCGRTEHVSAQDMVVATRV